MTSQILLLLSFTYLITNTSLNLATDTKEPAKTKNSRSERSETSRFKQNLWSNIETSKTRDKSYYDYNENPKTLFNPWAEQSESTRNSENILSADYDENVKTRYNPWGDVSEETPIKDSPWAIDGEPKSNDSLWTNENEPEEILTTETVEVKLEENTKSYKSAPRLKKKMTKSTTITTKSSKTGSAQKIVTTLRAINKEEERKDKRTKTVDEIVCHLKDVKLVEARFGNETHFLCLKLRPIGLSPLVTNSSILLLEPDTRIDVEAEDTDDDVIAKEYSLGQFTMMAYGFPMEDPASGSAEGYIGDDHQFYGVLHIRNRTLHADPYGRDNPAKSFGAFEHHNMLAPPRRRRDHETTQIDSLKLDRKYFPYKIEEPQSIQGTSRARICDLLLLADKQFYDKDANSSLNTVVQRMMHAITQADIIFRNADFNEDGVPDNIGFTVKYILVLTSDVTNKRVFGNLLDKEAVDGREYLMKFARLRRLSEVCLGVAFSGHAFHNRTLGLSFTSLGGGLGGAAGGLCDRRAYGRSFNTLAIAHATTADSERVPERIAALTLAHEMGHSFGAHHDDNFPLPECRDHLMGSQSTSAENPNHFEFSLCSKRLIATTLNSMSYCFTEESGPYCGNGIVEEGESCDCGLPSRCSIRDPCCTPRAGGILFYESGTVHKEGCSVAPTAECHPSQGLCCEANCRNANLTKSGIDCTMQNNVCTCNDPKLCRCGVRGRCMEDWTCHAVECALLGLEECQCTTSPGGEVGVQGMCGTCCLVVGLDRNAHCIGAEEAAREVLVHQTLPSDWPGDDLIGPNVTIRICSQECRDIELRAWPSGSACVSRGTVGVCSPRGICGKLQNTPRSNLYPNVMHVKMQLKSKSRKSLASKLCPTIFLVFLTTLVIL